MSGTVARTLRDAPEVLRKRALAFSAHLEEGRVEAAAALLTSVDTSAKCRSHLREGRAHRYSRRSSTLRNRHRRECLDLAPRRLEAST
jgi:hypothetical protein